MVKPAGRSRRAIALAGPTASGKSSAAFVIARALDAEIISVDSAQVYRGMDIGTAKPSAAELAAVPHHLIDIRDPLQIYNAAEFAADARRVVDEINARGRPALLVGGTMLYFKALFEGLDDMPPSDAAVRSELDARGEREGWPALHAELERVDPATAARLAPNDSQRIQRALEVFRLSGQPISSFHAAGKAKATNGWRSTPLFSLEPQDRAWLHQRIAERFDAMLAAGFLEEVRRLRLRGDLSAGLPSMRCVGYRQAWELLEVHEARVRDTQVSDQAFPMAQLRDRGIFATRQLAKRQLTWLRAMPGRRVIACDAPDVLAQLRRQMDAALP
jgi:tRNA dimethylallyltransferase